MNRLALASSLALALTAVLAAPGSAQTLTRITPEVASPGDLVILEGTSLGAVSRVDFTGNVGGFTFQLTASVTPLSVTSTEVRAVVPPINAFIGPCSFQGSDPLGFVSTDVTATTLPMFFSEETTTSPPGGPLGELATVGLGSTQPNGERAVGSFDLAGGPPATGNASYTPKVANAVPGYFSFLALGAPSAVPLPYGDGLVGLDVTRIYVLVAGPPVDATGVAALNLPLPAFCPPSTSCLKSACGIPVVAQWAVVDPGTGGVFVSNGMSFLL